MTTTILRQQIYQVINSCYELTKFPQAIVELVTDYAQLQGTMDSDELDEICWCDNGCAEEEINNKKTNSSIFSDTNWENVRIIFQQVDSASTKTLFKIPELGICRSSKHITYYDIYNIISKAKGGSVDFSIQYEYCFSTNKFLITILFKLDKL